MNRLPSRLLASAGVLALTVLCAGAGPLEDTFARMDRAAAGFRGVKADLSRVNHTAVLNEDDVESGTFVMKRSKSNDIRVLFDITKPEPKAYSFDGHKLEQYLPKVPVVQVYEAAGKYRPLVEEFLLLGFGTTSKELLDHYKVSFGGPETIGNEKSTRLQLIPKSPDLATHLTKVELWISDALGVPLQQKFYTPGENYNLFTYTHIMMNPNIADSAVKLNVPKSVKREYPLK